MLRLAKMANDRKAQRGFTLVEVLLAVVLLAIIIPTLVAGFTIAYMNLRETRMLELARVLTQMIMEEQLYVEPEDIVETVGPQPFADMPGFAYEIDLTDEIITVTVHYSFAGRTKQYQAVSLHD